MGRTRKPESADTAGRYLVPREYAERLGVDLKKVLAWIKSGELVAVNVARSRIGSPRWRISPAAIAAFELSRSSRPEPKPVRRTRAQSLPEVEEYYR